MRYPPVALAYSCQIMFLRFTTRKKDGKEHRYYSIVENVRAYYDILSRLTDDTASVAKHDYQLLSTRAKPAFSLHLPIQVKANLSNELADSSYSLTK